MLFEEKMRFYSLVDAVCRQSQLSLQLDNNLSALNCLCKVVLNATRGHRDLRLKRISMARLAYVLTPGINGHQWASPDCLPAYFSASTCADYPYPLPMDILYICAWRPQ